MYRLIRAELIKIRTTRAVWIITAALAVLVAAQAHLLLQSAADPQILDVEMDATQLAEVLSASTSLIAGAALLIGLMASTGEFRHRTITTTFLVRPHLHAILAAKLIACPLVAVGVAVVAMAGGIATTVPVLNAHHVTIELTAAGLPELFIAVPVAAAAFAALGVAVGAILRNPAATVGVVLLWMLAVEAMVLPYLLGDSPVEQWSLTSLTKGLLTAGESTPADLLPPHLATAMLIGYALALGLVSLAVDRNREV